MFFLLYTSNILFLFRSRDILPSLIWHIKDLPVETRRRMPKLSRYSLRMVIKLDVPSHMPKIWDCMARELGVWGEFFFLFCNFELYFAISSLQNKITNCMLLKNFTFCSYPKIYLTKVIRETWGKYFCMEIILWLSSTSYWFLIWVSVQWADYLERWVGNNTNLGRFSLKIFIAVVAVH